MVRWMLSRGKKVEKKVVVGWVEVGEVGEWCSYHFIYFINLFFSAFLFLCCAVVVESSGWWMVDGDGRVGWVLID